LSCGNRRSCERCALKGDNATLSGVVKMRKRRLTCVRALPGVGLTTSALARPAKRPSGQVTDRAEIDNHDAVLGRLHQRLDVAAHKD